jgi:hypothetical protein
MALSNNAAALAGSAVSYTTPPASQALDSRNDGEVPDLSGGPSAPSHQPPPPLIPEDPQLTIPGHPHHDQMPSRLFQREAVSQVGGDEDGSRL